MAICVFLGQSVVFMGQPFSMKAVSLSLFLSKSFFSSPCDIVNSQFWVQPVFLSVCWMHCRQPLGHAAEVIVWIYLSNWSTRGGEDYGGSCCGAEGTAVPQCSVPHYCFLMRRTEGLQRVSHLALRCMTVSVVLWVSVRKLWRDLLVLNSDKIIK